MDIEQRIQETQYAFPYHHLVRFGDGVFLQAKNLRWGYMYASYLECILETLHTLSFESLIDVGCGDGKFVLETKRRFPAKKIEGIDYSPQAIEFARAFSPNTHFYVGDITDTNVQTGMYDAASLIEVLEHIPPENTPAFLKALADRLNHNGFLVISVPSDNDPVSKKHYRHFNEKDLREVLKTYFEIATVRFVNRKGFLDDVVKALLTNRLFLLNSHRMRNSVYRFYKKHLFAANAKNGKRIIAVCNKK